MSKRRKPQCAVQNAVAFSQLSTSGLPAQSTSAVDAKLGLSGEKFEYAIRYWPPGAVPSIEHALDLDKNFHPALGFIQRPRGSGYAIGTGSIAVSFGTHESGAVYIGLHKFDGHWEEFHQIDLEELLTLKKLGGT